MIFNHPCRANRPLSETQNRRSEREGLGSAERLQIAGETNSFLIPMVGELLSEGIFHLYCLELHSLSVSYENSRLDENEIVPRPCRADRLIRLELRNHFGEPAIGACESLFRRGADTRNGSR